MIKQFISIAPLLAIMACAAAQKPVDPAPEPTPVAEVHEWDGKTPQDICVDAAVSVCLKVAQCEGDLDECATKLGEYCTTITKVVDPAVVYNVCKPAVEALVCGEEFPEVCSGLFE